MTGQIKATTNKLRLTYNNDTTYTIPRVEGFKVATDGTQVSGSYTKSTEFHGIKQEHSIDFTIDLKDVVEMDYVGKKGVISKKYLVQSGRVLTVTEWRTEEDYYNAAQIGVEGTISALVQFTKPTDSLQW